MRGEILKKAKKIEDGLELNGCSFELIVRHTNSVSSQTLIDALNKT